MKDRRRITGVLKTAQRGLVLEAEDGFVWALDIEPGLNVPQGGRATVEGRRSGYDRLVVDWIGAIEPSGN